MNLSQRTLLNLGNHMTVGPFGSLSVDKMHILTKQYLSLSSSWLYNIRHIPTFIKREFSFPSDLSLLCENYCIISVSWECRKSCQILSYVSFKSWPDFFLPYQLRLIGHFLAGIAVGVHEQLGVGVYGDEGLEVPVTLDQVHHIPHLDLRVSRGAVVGVRAGVPTGTGAWREKVYWVHVCETMDIIKTMHTYI